jgi:hypothetical protein
MPLQDIPVGTTVYRYAGTRHINIRSGNTHVGMTAIHHQVWVNPITADDNGLMEATAGPNTTTTTWTPSGGPNVGALVSGGVCTLDFARNIGVVVTHASSVVALSGTITGYDMYDLPLTEAWSVTAGTTSKTFTGKKAFKRVTSVTIVAAGNASADTVIIGTGSVLGLEVATELGATGAAVKEYVAGSLVTNGVIVALSTSTGDPRGTYTPNTAPDGSTTYNLWYLCDNPEGS